MTHCSSASDGVQVLADRLQRDVDDRAVEDGDTRAERDREQREPAAGLGPAQRSGGLSHARAVPSRGGRPDRRPSPARVDPLQHLQPLRVAHQPHHVTGTGQAARAPGAPPAPWGTTGGARRPPARRPRASARRGRPCCGRAGSAACARSRPRRRPSRRSRRGSSTSSSVRSPTAPSASSVRAPGATTPRITSSSASRPASLCARSITTV